MGPLGPRVAGLAGDLAGNLAGDLALMAGLPVVPALAWSGLGTTGKPAIKARSPARFPANPAILDPRGPTGALRAVKIGLRLVFPARPSLPAWKLACYRLIRLAMFTTMQYD